MLTNKIHVFDDPGLTAGAVAKLIISKIKEQEDSPLYFNLAVSGGSTPNLLFSMLADEYAAQIPWEKLRIFWVDERCVPPTDKESNYGTMNTLLLGKVPIPTANIFRMQGENLPAEEAVRYENLLHDELPEKNGLPQFDLILLGMGDDGHTASIFPDNIGLIHSPQTVATAIHRKSGQERITLTGNVICNAKHIAFVITGHAKADVLDAVISEKGDFERYPTYYILSNSHAELYLDYDAAEKL